MTPISCRGGSEGGFQGEEVPQNASPPYLPAWILLLHPLPCSRGLEGAFDTSHSSSALKGVLSQHRVPGRGGIRATAPHLVQCLLPPTHPPPAATWEYSPFSRCEGCGGTVRRLGPRAHYMRMEGSCFSGELKKKSLPRIALQFLPSPHNFFFLLAFLLLKCKKILQTFCCD